MREPQRPWPALMDLRTAAEYLSLAPGSALSLMHRENVRPIELGARLRRWRRSDLDALLDALGGLRREGDSAAHASSEEGLDRALAAVERRAARRPRNPHEARQAHPTG